MTFRKSGLLATTSAIALLFATPALAAGEMNTPAPQGGSQTESDSTMQKHSQVKADDLVGKDLETPAGEEIGDVESVIINKDGGVAAIIVNVGGFLEVGEREVVVGWKEVKVAQNADALQTDLTKAELRTLPEYKYKDPENRGKAFEDRNYLDGMGKGPGSLGG